MGRWHCSTFEKCILLCESWKLLSPSATCDIHECFSIFQCSSSCLHSFAHGCFCKAGWDEVAVKVDESVAEDLENVYEKNPTCRVPSRVREGANPDLISNIKIRSAFAITCCQKCWDNIWGWRAWQAMTGCQGKVFACWVSKSCFTSESGSQVFFWEAYTVAVSKYALFIFSSWDPPSDTNYFFSLPCFLTKL